tara:strand:- start:1088 stop:2038 length:951 start_codon:yes stop_codon:yes gene_type:complete
VKSILIFRTDRIGDFLISSILISSIKRKYPNVEIDIVCSDFNFNYVKSFNFFKNVFLYPKTFLKKIYFFFSLKTYDYIFTLDGKKRSIYYTIFNLSQKKILFTPSKKIKFFFNIFFDHTFLINYNYPKIDLIKNCLHKINCNYSKLDLNFLLNFNNIKNYKSPFKNDYIILNFDEKWIFNKYIKTYKNIEPNIDELIIFISDLSKNQNLILTNGFIENPVLEKLKEKNILQNQKNFIIKDKIDIFELQFLIKNSSCLITCHGAPSHIGSNYNVNIIDIVDNSEIKFFQSYNFHFNNKVQIIRDDFKILSKKIISLI